MQVIFRDGAGPVRRSKLIVLGTLVPPCLAAAWLLIGDERAPEAAIPAGVPAEGGYAASVRLDPPLSEREAFYEMLSSLPRASDNATDPAPSATPAAGTAPEPAVVAHAGPSAIPVSDWAGPGKAASAPPEEIELTRAERRAVQRRLGMAGHPAGPPDGIFGPKTRQAIAELQKQLGLAPTGQLDKATASALRKRTDAEYAAWAESRHVEASRKRARSAPAPASGHGATDDGCARGPDGEIIPHQGFTCDLRGLLAGGTGEGGGFERLDGRR